MKFTYQNEAKERLDKYLASELSNISRSQIKKLILDGQVLVNKEKPSVHEWLHAGDVVDIKLKDKNPEQAKSVEYTQPEIIFEDDNYVIVNKPSGLLVHPTEKKETNTLVGWLRNKYPQVNNFGDQKRPGLAHRLDKDVSGIILLTLTEEAYNHLKHQFQGRTIEKHYTALVHGKVLNDEGLINTNLERDKKTGLMKAYSDIKNEDVGKEAITKYRVLERFINYTLLDVQIITGRTHQIRAHLMSIGHSIVGDKMYETRDVRKSKKTTSLDRPFLHATTVSFVNLAGDQVQYQAPLPEELGNFLKSIK